MPVALDGSHIADFDSGLVLTELAACSTLAQQVPTLVKGLLEMRQALRIGSGV